MPAMLPLGKRNGMSTRQGYLCLVPKSLFRNRLFITSRRTRSRIATRSLDTRLLPRNREKSIRCWRSEFFPYSFQVDF
jgi:hypothetical protein